VALSYLLLNSDILSRVSLLRICSILQQSLSAVSSLTPNFSKKFLIVVCLVYTSFAIFLPSLVKVISPYLSLFIRPKFFNSLLA
jgi:hypothetical protein